MKIYLASPLFTEYEKIHVSDYAAHLRNLGHEVYVPMEHQIEDAWSMPNHVWATMVFNEDVEQIRKCDKVVCLYYGLYSDSGTAWECGFAYGINKPVELVDLSGRECSLMVVQGAVNAFEFANKEQT